MSKIITFYFFLSLNRPLGLKEVEPPRTCRQSAYEGGKLVRPERLPPLSHPLGETPGPYFC